MNSSIFINPLSDITGIVPSSASLNISGFIFFLGKIMSGGKTKTGHLQQMPVTVCPLSTETILKTIHIPFEEITFRILFGTFETSLLSTLNMQ